MKKLFLYTVVALATLSVSCQKDRITDENYADVRINVCAPAPLATKVSGDGLLADNLVFGVFDEDGVELADLRQGDWTRSQSELKFDSTTEEGNPRTTVTVRLLKGKTYSFVFWAQNKDVTCYDFTSMNAVRVDYTKDNVSNNEARDAFYACVDSGVITDGTVVEAVLKRPSMQLNIGTDPEDLAAAVAAGLDVDGLYVEVSVDDVASGMVTDFTSHAYEIPADQKVQASFSAGKSPVAETYPAEGREMLTVKFDKGNNEVVKKDYEWLGMNYILTSLEKDDNKTVRFTIYEGTPENPTLLPLVSYTVDNVSFQANYRTNIVGNLLTADGEVEVFVSPIFDGNLSESAI